MVALQDALLGKVRRGVGRRFQDVHGHRAAAIKAHLAVRAQGGQGPAGRQSHGRVVLREKDPVLSGAAGEALGIVGGIDQEGALADGAGLRVAQVRGEPSLLDLLQVGVAGQIRAKDGGVHLDPGILLAIVVQVRAGAAGQHGHLHLVGGGRRRQRAGQRAHDLATARHPLRIVAQHRP